MSELTKFRTLKDDFFKNDPDSPLTLEQKKNFKGLQYFPENPDLRLELSIEKTGDARSLKMQTTGGGFQDYQLYGKLRFQVDGQDVELTLYQSESGFFLPFVDSLKGKETYPAGRYLEPTHLGKGKFLVDFNLAYNPYCAYNERWSCPLTPFENHLKVPIRAGEKIFK